MDEIAFARWVDAVEARLEDLPIKPWAIACSEPTSLEAQLATAELQRRGHNVLLLPAKSTKISFASTEPVYELFKPPNDEGELK